MQVLLVHADADGSDRIRQALSMDGCEAALTHVHDVTGFLAAMESWRFEVILLDYRPPFHGGAVLAAARRWWPAMPVIALCARAAEPDGRLALLQGAVEYVPQDEWFRLSSMIRPLLAAPGTSVVTHRLRGAC